MKVHIILALILYTSLITSCTHQPSIQDDSTNSTDHLYESATTDAEERSRTDNYTTTDTSETSTSVNPSTRVEIIMNSSPEDWLFIQTYQAEWVYINLSDAINGIKTLITADDLEEKFVEEEIANNYYIDKISSDGQYALLWHNTGSAIGNNENDGKRIIYNLVDRKVEREFEYNYGISNQLNKYIYSKDGQLTCYDLQSNKESIMYDYQFGMGPEVMSTDDRYIVSGIEDAFGCYLIIYDVEKCEIVEKVNLGKNDDEEFRMPIWITQWHTNNEIYYNFRNMAYKYNFGTKEITELGKYMFYPFLTSDEKYIVYNRLKYNPSEDEVYELSDYGEMGFFVRNVETQEDIRILKDNPYEKDDFYILQLITTNIAYESK